MNGLASPAPSQSAVRLALGAILLLLIQNALLLLAPGLASEARMLIIVLTPIAFAALIASLIGIPEPSADHWRKRHGR